MLTSFLFTPRQQRLLALFVLHPDKRYNYAALRNELGGGVSALYHYLHALEKAGVVKTSKGTLDVPGSKTVVSRNSRWYQANTNHPLYPELRSIAVKTFGVVDPIRDALKPFASKIERAFVFGSIVKQTDTYESDIDVMVVGRVRKGTLVMALEAAKKLTGREIHANVYGSDEWPAAMQDPVIRAILEGPTLELHFSARPEPSGDQPSDDRTPQD